MTELDERKKSHESLKYCCAAAANNRIEFCMNIVGFDMR